jgi:hypothetical protein
MSTKTLIAPGGSICHPGSRLSPHDEAEDGSSLGSGRRRTTTCWRPPGTTNGYRIPRAPVNAPRDSPTETIAAPIGRKNETDPKQ